MRKQIVAQDTGGLPGLLMMVAFIIAGAAIMLWGVSTLASGRPDATSQFVLSLVLGGAFVAIGAFVLRGRIADRKKLAWLNEHGAWITARPVDVRTITTDSTNRPQSYCLILEPDEDAKQRYGLQDLTFETAQIHARSVPESYRDLVIDVVIDPARPSEVYIVSFDAQALWNSVG